MNAKQVQKFVTRYLDALECHVIEKGPAHMIVKLSPEADKDLTNRTYYWNFVQNTGAPAETVTFCFIFDPDKMKPEASTGAQMGSGYAPGGTPPVPLGVAAAPMPGNAVPHGAAVALTPGNAGQPGPGAAPTPGNAGQPGPGAAPTPGNAGQPGPVVTPTSGNTVALGAGTAPPQGHTAALGASAAALGASAAPPQGNTVALGAAGTSAYPAAAGTGLPASQSAAGQPPGPAATLPGAGQTAIAQPAPAPGSILAHFFGTAPPPPAVRMPRDEVTFGSRRLEQIFAAVCRRGKCVRLFEQPTTAQAGATGSGYSTWLCVNYKVELTCDMKREEMHSLGIHLGTGRLVDRFVERMPDLKLTPKLPAGVPLQQARFTLSRASAQLENEVERRVLLLDHNWADQALSRLEEELAIIDVYYAELLASLDEEAKPQVQAQYNGRRDETYWQYRPRITATVVNCGLFHLLTDPEQV